MLTTPFGEPATEVPLPRSPLALVVAQVRFERIASIGSEDFIAGFQEAIRNVYPVMHREQQVGLLVASDGQATAPEVGTVWRFDERPERWQVSLAQDFVALSTPRYTRHRDFLDRLKELLVAVQRELGVRFCERLGIRYVDRVTDVDVLSRLDRLVRSEVAGTTLTEPGERGVSLTHCIADGAYSLPDDLELRGRWGVLPPMAIFDPTIPAVDARSWVLDLDVSTRSQMPFEPTALAMKAEIARERIYRFFRWAVLDEFLVAHGGQP